MEKKWAQACIVGYSIRICVLGKTKDHEDQSAKNSYDDSPCQHSKTSFAVPRGNRKILSYFVYVLLVVGNVSHHRSVKIIICAELCACVRACMCVFKSTHIFSIIR